MGERRLPWWFQHGEFGIPFDVDVQQKLKIKLRMKIGSSGKLWVQLMSGRRCVISGYSVWGLFGAPGLLWVMGKFRSLGESEMLSSRSEAQMCNIWILRGIKGMRNWRRGGDVYKNSSILLWWEKEDAFDIPWGLFRYNEPFSHQPPNCFFRGNVLAFVAVCDDVQ